MPKQKVQGQRQKLIEAAHMVEADKDEAAFEKRLKKIAKAKPTAEKEDQDSKAKPQRKG